MEKKNITFEERQLRRRKRKVNSLRLTQGFIELYRKRIKRLIFLLFNLLVIVIWFLFIYKSSNNLDISRLLIYIIYWLFSLLCWFGLIMWFGTPRKYQQIEDDIKDVFDIKEEHKVPILKSIVKTPDKYLSHCFYSPDFSKEKYEEKKSDISQKLGMVILYIEYQGDYVYLMCVPKNKIKDNGELTDDRI